jgi:diguanylate cyclase (GGDEF)-like protein
MPEVQDRTWRQRPGMPPAIRLGWPWRWPLFANPAPAIGYMLAVMAAYCALAGLGLWRTAPRARDLALFAALMACGAVCVEVTRRLGHPAGVSRDLLSAWWLPVALLLPPAYALAAPAVLGLLSYLRVRRGPVYRRALSTAALGLSGAASSACFRWLARAAAPGGPAGWLARPGTRGWLASPQQAGLAVCCAAAFTVMNTCLIAIAAWLAEPEGKLADMLWDRERMLVDLAETCAGVLVTIACVLSPLLLCVALPPVALLQRSLMHQQLKAAARTDAKTGLLNAAAWQREAGQEIARALRRGEPAAVLLIDVDHFKRVNDTYGHLTGDDVLRGLAGELRQQLRETDLVGRFGGEEFAVLLPDTATAQACRIAERLRRGTGLMRVLAGEATVGVTISVGVASLGQHGSDLFELLAAADLALYHAKSTGRDRVCLHDPADSAPMTRRAPRPAQDT